MRYETEERLAFAGIVAAVVAIAVVVLGGVVFGIRSATHVEHRTCTVTGKERLLSGSGKNIHREQRVYTRECGILTVGDSLFDGHFDSADTFHGLAKGHVYRMKTRGLRVGFFSMFPNIVEAQEVSK